MGGREHWRQRVRPALRRREGVNSEIRRTTSEGRGQKAWSGPSLSPGASARPSVFLTPAVCHLLTQGSRPLARQSLARFSFSNACDKTKGIFNLLFQIFLLSSYLVTSKLGEELPL